jgi:hypothetical protein
MNREWAMIISILLMCLAGIACFALKYHKPRPPIIFTDPTAARIHAISKLSYNVQKVAIEKLHIDNSIIIDSVYYRLLRDTTFLNKIRENK